MELLAFELWLKIEGESLTLLLCACMNKASTRNTKARIATNEITMNHQFGWIFLSLAFIPRESSDFYVTMLAPMPPLDP